MMTKRTDMLRHLSTIADVDARYAAWHSLRYPRAESGESEESRNARAMEAPEVADVDWLTDVPVEGLQEMSAYAASGVRVRRSLALKAALQQLAIASKNLKVAPSSALATEMRMAVITAARQVTDRTEAERLDAGTLLQAATGLEALVARARDLEGTGPASRGSGSPQ